MGLCGTPPPKQRANCEARPWRTRGKPLETASANCGGADCGRSHSSPLSTSLDTSLSISFLHFRHELSRALEAGKTRFTAQSWVHILSESP